MGKEFFLTEAKMKGFLIERLYPEKGLYALSDCTGRDLFKKQFKEYFKITCLVLI